MANSKEKISIINQSIKDAAFIKQNKIPLEGLTRILLHWLFYYSLAMALDFGIDYMNMNLQLYNYAWYFPIIHIVKIIVYFFPVILTIIHIKKSYISLIERRILNTWLIFPLLLSIVHSIPILSVYINMDAVISFYNSFSIANVITLISIVYIYSYYRNKGIKILALFVGVYILLSFIFLIYYRGAISLNTIEIIIFQFVNYIQMYGIMDLVSIFIMIFLLNKEEE